MFCHLLNTSSNSHINIHRSWSIDCDHGVVIQIVVIIVVVPVIVVVVIIIGTVDDVDNQLKNKSQARIRNHMWSYLNCQYCAGHHTKDSNTCLTLSSTSKMVSSGCRI